MTLSRTLSARRHVDDQRGLALIFVLGAIALTAMIVVALLGLSMASARLTRVQAQQASERRAADAALETGMGRIARSVVNNPCTDVPPGSSVTSPAELDTAGDPIDVELRCRPLPLPTQTTPSTPSSSPEVLGGPGVEIVGPSYGGRLSAPAGGIADASLVATGADALRFDADVTVRQGANVRSTVTGNAGASVAGQYEQGLAGVGATASSRCGTLDPAGGDVQAAVSDRDATPRCETPTALGLAPRSGTLFSATESIESREVPPDCPPQTVVEFQPGRYNAIQTARLNDLLDGTCPGRTFWFRTGKYLFDVNDASASAAPGNVAGDRFALVIDDPTAKVVFGASSGWSAAAGASAADFPRACDVAQSGASIQLTGRSTIRHRQGRVAICPFFNTATDSPYPAIVQGGSSPSQPILVSSNLPADGVLPTVSTLCWTQVLLWYQWASCGDPARTRTVRTTWASAGTAQLDSAILLVETTENPPVHQARHHVQARVQSGGLSCSTGFLAGGRTHQQHTAIDLMDPANPGSCRTVLAGRTEAVFEGATIFIDLLLYDPGDPNGLPGSNCGLAPGCQVTFTVSDVALRTNTIGVSAGGAQSAAGHWANPAAAIARESPSPQVSRVVQDTPCFVADERCRHDDADRVRSITMTGFDPAASGLGPDEPVEHLGLRLESQDAGQSWASNEVDSTWVRVDLELPAAGPAPAATCSVTQNGFSRSRRAIHVDLFPAGGTCRALVERSGRLQGASATVSIRSRCMWWTNPFSQQFERMPTDLDGDCNQVRLPEFDRIQLDVTPALIQRPPSAQVTIDATTAGSGASFTVFGDTLTPDLDVDLRWRGAVTDLPVFGGVMSVRSLGSTQDAGATMGVVCCSPPAVSTVLLEAMIGSVVEAEAQLFVGRPGSGGTTAATPPQVPQLLRSVAIRDWSYCSNNCTEVLSATTIAPNPSGG